MKKTFYTEAAYLFGIIILAFGTVLMEKADFGMSMVVAPAYIIHLKVSEYLSFFTFGMAEYLFQAFLIIILSVSLLKFKISYLYSFVTALFYGFVLDGMMLLFSLIPLDNMCFKVVCYTLGMIICSLGVSLLFHTYISPEAYELFVKEISQKFKIDINKCKTVYDCTSCSVGVILSFVFFGLWHFEGVKWGTILCALLNGFLIGVITKILEKHFTFKDRFPLRKFFEK